MKLADANDLARRRLRDFVKTYKIEEIYSLPEEDRYVVIVNDSVDIGSVGSIIWRALEKKADIYKQSTRVSLSSKFYPCYRYGRWIQ